MNFYSIVREGSNADWYTFQLFWNNQNVGYAAYYIDRYNNLNLQLFKIKSEYRRQGHGTALYYMTENYFKSRYSAITLQSISSALSFWTRLGYRSVYSFSDELFDMVKQI